MNLWAEFDNQHAQEEAVGPKQTRRLTEQVVLSSLHAWLLQDSSSCLSHHRAATRIYRRCYWIDAWGINARANNRDAATGSSSSTNSMQVLPPILQPIASLAKVLAQASKPIVLQGIVLGAGSSRRKEQRAGQHGTMDGEEEATAALFKAMPKLPRESDIVRASWLEIAPPLLKEIASS